MSSTWWIIIKDIQRIFCTPDQNAEASLDTETHRDTQRHTETHRDTQRYTETICGQLRKEE